MSTLNPKRCYRALAARDRRQDGRFFFGVTTTGIYCRPVCPARTAKFANCRFFPTAEEARAAGFRACRRCRPELRSDSAARRGTANTVARGLALIDSGALDGSGRKVEALAESLGIGARHLRRLFRAELGQSPLAVAETRRLARATELVLRTRLPLTNVALVAGFSSVRRFNEVFRARHGTPPSAHRGQEGTGS